MRIYLADSASQSTSDDSRPSTALTTRGETHLLSPDHAHTALPALVEMLGGPPSRPQSQPQSHSRSRSHSQPSQLQQNPLPAFPTYTTPDLRPGSFYDEAPLPPNVVYPEPPGRSKSRASDRRVPVVASSSRSEDTGDSISYRSRKRAGSVADSLSFGGRLSPLSLFHAK